MFVWPEHTVRAVGPHHVESEPGYHTVDIQCRKVEGAFTATVDLTTAWLAHYVTKSREDFARKVARGSAMAETGKTWSFFDAVEQHSTEVCPFVESYEYAAAELTYFQVNQ